MEHIANLVVQKLVKLQQDGEIYLGLAQEEVLLAEIARLTTLLSMYEEREPVSYTHLTLPTKRIV